MSFVKPPPWSRRGAVGRWAAPAALAVAGVAVGVTALQCVRETFLPSVTGWESHIITVAFSVLIVAAIVAAFHLYYNSTPGAEALADHTRHVRAHDGPLRLREVKL